MGLLIALGADATLKTNRNQSCLDVAQLYGNDECISLLKKAGSKSQNVDLFNESSIEENRIGRVNASQVVLHNAIGAGEYGTVYTASIKGDNNIYAVKKMRLVDDMKAQKVYSLPFTITFKDHLTILTHIFPFVVAI